MKNLNISISSKKKILLKLLTNRSDKNIYDIIDLFQSKKSSSSEANSNYEVVIYLKTVKHSSSIILFF